MMGSASTRLRCHRRRGSEKIKGVGVNVVVGDGVSVAGHGWYQRRDVRRRRSVSTSVLLSASMMGFGKKDELGPRPSDKRGTSSWERRCEKSPSWESHDDRLQSMPVEYREKGSVLRGEDVRRALL